MSEERRSDTQRRLQRSPRFLAAYLGITIAWCGLTSLPPVARVLGVRGLDMWIGCFACWGASVLAAVGLHAFGARDRRYLCLAVLETLTYVVALMTLVYRTRPDSIVWLVYALLCALNGTIATQRAGLRVGMMLPPVALAIVYAAVDHDPASAGIVLVAGVVSVLAFEVQARTAARLDAQTVAVEAAERELSELRVTKDRERIARDLHDGLGADLTAIAWKAERLLVDEKAGPDELRTIALRAAQGIDDLRTVVWALKEPRRTWDDLVVYLSGRVGELSTRATSIEVVAAPSQGSLSGEEASHVVRAVEEAVRNAARHAAATRITVRLALDPTLEVVVEDDGKGIEASVTRRSGMQHLEARAAALGATVEVQTGPAGTRIGLRR